MTSLTTAPEETDVLTRLRGDLLTHATTTGAREVAYSIIESPLGRLLLAATPVGLVRVAFEREDFDTVLGTLAEKIGPRILRDADPVDRAAHELAEYFAGERRDFDVTLDRRLTTPFRGEVQRFLPSIEFGHTLSYRDVAEALGRPRAMRAVGTACATNPLPIVVPCHRVLRTDGQLGGYIGGLDAKRALLESERTRA
ncbi:methylated-DNA--[protein]-cysteine S-methyltransferase [Mycetocola sp. JXN-3]|uniref:methylated-DNA--[protein]-cysteine S-methyltransferase n=1 Tax=Mycetocola sp. JXN-3 TaxID=2116510 RepID=UPI00165D1D30|nr:methylated-DNA--[protein]-cysteine S-methyltransferase [Mycetocola sp. JXN-3]